MNDLAGPDGIDGWFGVLGRIVLSGLLVAAIFGGVSLALASFTDRRAVASAAIVLFVLISAALTSTIVEAGNASVDIYALNLFVGPFELVFRIYGEDNGPQPDMSTAVLWLAAAGWILGSWCCTWWRYRTMRVDR